MKKCLKNYNSKFILDFFSFLSIACYFTTFSSCDTKGKVHENPDFSLQNPDFSLQIIDNKTIENACKDLSEKIKTASTMDDLIDAWERGSVVKNGNNTLITSAINGEVRDALAKKFIMKELN